VVAVSQELLDLLAGEVGGETIPALFEQPSERWFLEYLVRLEQLLAVRCSALDGIDSRSFLSGEREIVDGNLRLCLENPRAVNVRLLLAQTVASLRGSRAEVVSEFGDRLALLQKEYPLPEPAQSIVTDIFSN
jgi:hypothetical protein